MIIGVDANFPCVFVGIGPADVIMYSDVVEPAAILVYFEKGFDAFLEEFCFSSG